MRAGDWDWDPPVFFFPLPPALLLLLLGILLLGLVFSSLPLLFLVELFLACV